jgi:hypothetical protein
MARCLHPSLRIPNPDWQDVEKGPPALFSQRVEAHRTATGKSLSRQARGGRVRMLTLRLLELPDRELLMLNDCVKRESHFVSCFLKRETNNASRTRKDPYSKKVFILSKKPSPSASAVMPLSFANSSSSCFCFDESLVGISIFTVKIWSPVC